MVPTPSPPATPAILISKVGPRDGLQSVARTLTTAAKLRWITALHAAGLREIEVGSFVPPPCCHRWRTWPTWCVMPSPCGG